MTTTPTMNDAVNAALEGVDPSAPSVSKFVPLDRALAPFTGLDKDHLVSVTISKSGNVKVRANQSARSQTATLLVGVMTNSSESDDQGARRAMVDMVAAGAGPRGWATIHRDVDGRWKLDWAVLAVGADMDGVASRLSDVGVEVTRVTSAVAIHSRAAAVAPEARPDLATSEPTVPLVLEDRVRRMVRLAVASRAAVMLVGPPGTGKSQLLGEVLGEVALDPASYGMTMAHDASVVTLDESWTTRELVGGETVDDAGHLRFSPGHVLQAIADDRWLVLDEANRADLDRIFGGLLTWLSGQTVTVGRVSSHPNAGPVRLGWNDKPTSRVVGAEELMADEPSGDSVDYLAGTEWRLLGTYNALDAQRVFRFGLALGRRFAHIPIEAPGPDAFATALRPRLTGVPEDRRSAVADRLQAIYAAHRALEGAIIGPAMFLAMPAYIAAGLSEGDLPLDELIAEAYLSGLGVWLARLDEDQLDRLEEFLGSSSRLGEQWAWVRNQLPSLQ